MMTSQLFLAKIQINVSPFSFALILMQTLRAWCSPPIIPQLGACIGNIIHKSENLLFQAEMLDAYDNGHRKKFFDLWTEHLAGNKPDEDLTTQKLEFYLNIYFAIYARKHGVEVVVWSLQQ